MSVDYDPAKPESIACTLSAQANGEMTFEGFVRDPNEVVPDAAVFISSCFQRAMSDPDFVQEMLQWAFDQGNIAKPAKAN